MGPGFTSACKWDNACGEIRANPYSSMQCTSPLVALTLKSFSNSLNSEFMLTAQMRDARIKTYLITRCY